MSFTISFSLSIWEAGVLAGLAGWFWFLRALDRFHKVTG